MFTGGAFSFYWNVPEPKGAQGLEISTSSASLGFGAVGASGAHVQLHCIRRYSTLWMTMVRCIPYNRLRMPARYFIFNKFPRSLARYRDSYLSR
jgi:hypothetical protein